MHLSRLQQRLTDAHSKLAERRIQMKWAYQALTFVVTSFIILYGFAKLNGSQFTILASELDKPMGQVSSFWVTWYYFGYSPVYGNFLGLVQILGGILLMFRKTTLLGSCILNIFAGIYELSGDELRLSGKFVKSSEETIFVLGRRNQGS